MTFSDCLRRVAWSALFVAALAAVCPTAAAAQTVGDDKLGPMLEVRSRQLSGRSRVIVEFKNEPDARVLTGSRGAAGRQLLSARAQVVEVENLALHDLGSHPQVARMHIDHPAFATMERTGAAIAATIARQSFRLTGKGIGVAVIDSGITAWHDDLYLAGVRSPRAAPRIVHFKDFTKASNPRIWRSEQPSDEYGHGTHVAGIIAGNGFDSNGARTGIAPGANLIGLKVLDANGQGYISDVIAAIDYAIAVRKTYNIRVINLSVASGVFESYETDPLTQAARRAVDAGIVVIAAAGNIGTNMQGDVQYGGITSPGNAPWVLTVGAASHEGTAARSNDTLARFSSRGPTWIDFAAKPDLVAPGVGIESLADPHSTLYASFGDYLLDGARSTAYKPYLSLTGTSMAAPVVAGTVALMLEANPNLTPNAVKALLQYTAEVREGESFLAQGAGLLNALGAVRMATFVGAARKGSLVASDTIEAERIAWSRHIIWGNQRIVGGLRILVTNSWARGVTWGAEAANIVWSEHVRADNIVWSEDCGGADCEGVVWGARSKDGSVWGTARVSDKVAWKTDNIVWSEAQSQNIVWSEAIPDNVIWSPIEYRRRTWAGPE
jgi:serine protease AprX